jgi:uncharacterized membrane protein YfhO
MALNFGGNAAHFSLQPVTQQLCEQNHVGKTVTFSTMDDTHPRYDITSVQKRKINAINIYVSKTKKINFNLLFTPRLAHGINQRIS